MIRTLPILFCLGAPVLAQHLTLAEGTLASDLRIVQLDEANPNAPATTVLQNVELLPVERTGRTMAQADDPSVARRVVRKGIARIEFADGAKLFRYRRAAGAFWGFLHVDATGAARVVLELAGIGANGLQDPFVDRVAVAADGTMAAMAKTAGGLHLVRLDGGIFASTGRSDRLVAAGNVLPASVMLGTQGVYFQTDTERLWRLGYADGATPVDISPPALPNGEWKDEMALSGDGNTLVFLYGPRDQQRPYLVVGNGLPSPLPVTPSKYEEPGYLPEGAGEPAMLIDQAGTRLLCIDSLIRDELYLVDLGGTFAPMQFTGDTIFQPYIGVHILPKFHAQQLVLAIGDPASMDWYRVDLNAAGGTVANLTGTGSPTPPFTSGQLDPRQAAECGPALLVAEQVGGVSRLRRLDPITGANGLFGGALTTALQSGSSLGGPCDVLARTATGTTLWAAPNALPLATIPDPWRLQPPVHGPVLSATFASLPGLLGAAVYYLRDGTVVTGGIEGPDAEIVATSGGHFLILGNQLRLVGPGVYTALQRPAAAIRMCLSGAAP